MYGKQTQATFLAQRNCGHGKPFSDQFAPFGAYCTLVPVRSGSIPAISIATWTTPQRDTFAVERIATAAVRPTSGTTLLTSSDYLGWVLSESGWTVIVTTLPSGDSVAFASTGNAQQCQKLAAVFLRLGSDPMSLQ